MIWFDLDNSPHVPLFKPILEELARRGERTLVTARNFAQTVELLNLWKIPHYAIGVHGGRNKVKKVLNTLHRGLQLKRFCRGKDIRLAVSHGSRSQLIAAKMLGIPSILMLDYEYTESGIFNRLATNLLMPAAIPDERLSSAGFDLNKIIRYDGYKEELYLSTFQPDPDFRKSINVPESKILVVFRPPGMTGNYHDIKSETLLIEAVKHFSAIDNTVCLIVNRGDVEKKYILSKIKLQDNIVLLEKAVDGLQLLFAADIAVSGGGTMNRESALMGTKTYSIFTGKRPYLDEYLAEQGKLIFIERPEEIKNISPVKTESKQVSRFNSGLTKKIADLILSRIDQRTA